MSTVVHNLCGNYICLYIVLLTTQSATAASLQAWGCYRQGNTLHSLLLCCHIYHWMLMVLEQ